MSLQGIRIAYALCGSHCTLGRSITELLALKELGAQIIPIVSEAVDRTDTRFGRAADIVSEIEKIAGREVIRSIRDAEPLGPRTPADLMIIAPCTGNTLSKIASGITDTTVTMAAKAHLRQDKPLIIALATNDAMSQSLKSIATLLTRKSVYFLPLRQDDPVLKPYSLVADFERIKEAAEAALTGRQLRPLFL